MDIQEVKVEENAKGALLLLPLLHNGQGRLRHSAHMVGICWGRYVSRERASKIR